MSGSSRNKKAASLLSIPDAPIVSIEHPCIVQNVDKAVHMLGGDNEIADSLEPDNEKPLGLKFRPDDPFSREVVSYNKKTNNLLLRVTVPRRTGRKRKRGSAHGFEQDPTDAPVRKDVSYVLRSLEDNAQRYQAEILGPIYSTHIWRTMPDFVYSSQGSMFLDEVTTKVLPQHYPHLKQWSLPRSSALASEDTEAIPPPAFSMQSLPQNYVHRQNPSLRHTAARRADREKQTPVEAVVDKSQVGEA
jgi:general transcription factor 3C polypeptide 5 (transcription factor C subunit 1)